MDTLAEPEVFIHIKVVMAMIISLSLARLLNGLAGIIQHPGRQKTYAVHLGWVLSIFLLIIHAWWWEHRLQTVSELHFGAYLFLVCFCCLFFLLCSMLFPSAMDDYAGYRDYFYSRRKWFFGILGLTYALDIADTFLKGRDYAASLGWDFPAHNLVYILLCAIAMATANPRFHLAFVSLGLVYQLSYIFRVYNALA
ncbi:MAG: hypothetical protein ACOH2J_07465 [Allorhizobium sp.]